MNYIIKNIEQKPFHNDILILLGFNNQTQLQTLTFIDLKGISIINYKKYINIHPYPKQHMKGLIILAFKSNTAPKIARSVLLAMSAKLHKCPIFHYNYGHV
jgi:hypothetical protein